MMVEFLRDVTRCVEMLHLADTPSSGHSHTPTMASKDPKLRQRRGLGCVWIDGRDYMLGPIETAPARYRLLLRRWRWNGCNMPPDLDGRTVTVKRVIRDFVRWAEVPAQRKGATKHRFAAKHLVNFRLSLQPLRDLFGWMPAGLLTTEELAEVRQVWIDDDLCTSTINARVRNIIRVWKYASGEARPRLIPESAWLGLKAISHLRPGDEMLSGPQKVEPVSWPTVEATLPHLPTPVQRMVKLQWFTGMRPGEVCIMRWADINTGWDEIDGVQVWSYTPERHKLSRQGQQRIIALGPMSQQVLIAARKADPLEHLFNPQDVRRNRRYGSAYTTQSYGNAIRRACAANGIEHWGPNRIRHAAATAADELLGVETAAELLGHTNTTTTERYLTRRRVHAMRYVAMHG